MPEPQTDTAPTPEQLKRLQTWVEGTHISKPRLFNDDDRAALKAILASHADLARRLLEAKKSHDEWAERHLREADESRADMFTLRSQMVNLRSELAALRATLSERERELAEARAACAAALERDSELHPPGCDCELCSQLRAALAEAKARMTT